MFKRTLLAVVGAFGLSIAASATYATSTTPPAGCASFIQIAEQQYGIPNGLLMAIGMVESRLNPLALNRAGRTLSPANYSEAAGMLTDSSGAPLRNISIGCMQIFARYHLDEVNGQPERFLDPETNVDYAARLLLFLRDHGGSWRDAVGRYHAGPNSPHYERYICAIDRQLREQGSEFRLGCRT